MSSDKSPPPRRNPRRGGAAGESVKKRKRGEQEEPLSPAPVAAATPTAAPATESPAAEQLHGLVKEVSNLRRSLVSMLGAATVPSAPLAASALDGEALEEAWGTLTTPTTCFRISGNSFSIGRSMRCNICIPDSGIPNYVARFLDMNGSPFIECLSTQADMLSVNGKHMRKQGKFLLRDGDEIVVSGLRSYVFSFDKVGTDTEGVPQADEEEARKRPKTSIEPLVPLVEVQLREKEPETPAVVEEPKTPGSPAVPDEEIRRLLLDQFEKFVTLPEDNAASFGTFPYHLEDSMKEILLNSVYLFVKRPEFASFGSNLSTLTPTILLEGPFGTELYQLEVIKALAAGFAVPLVVFDAASTALASTRPSNESGGNEKDFMQIERSTRFKKGDRVRFVGDGSPKSRGPQSGATGEVILSFNEDNPRRVGVRFDVPIGNGVSLGGLCESDRGFFASTQDLRPESEDFTPQAAVSAAVDALFALAERHKPCILAIRDVEEVVFHSYHRYKMFESQLSKLPEGVVFIGCKSSAHTKQSRSKLSDRLMGKSAHHSTLLEFSIFDQLRNKLDEGESTKMSKLLEKLLPTVVTIKAPLRNPALAQWQQQLEVDMKALRRQSNCVHIRRILLKNNVEADLESIKTSLLEQKMFKVATLERLVGWAIGRYLRDEPEPTVVDDKLQLSTEALNHALSLQISSQKTSTSTALSEVDADEFEKKILGEVVPAEELNVRFEDIGALDKVKETLKELVLLPLTRPELFRKGNLTKPCKGVLLFGPPGTGKTMLAKAVATECSANFINVSMASIGSKWFGEGEKYAKAVFTLAHKIAPSVIFIDEVDSILGKREKAGEHEAMRKIKNTMMSMWDGLKTDNERVIVLSASNRPFDLDDAVLRRLPRRLLVDLPDAENRARILQVICAEEDMDDTIDYAEIAKLTENFSGSDLKNLCVAACYMPIREILDKERAEGKDVEAQSLPDAPEVAIRPLSMADFQAAAKQVAASVAEDTASMVQLKQWNANFGDGGSRDTIGTLSMYL